jgi:nucleoside-diphosphate-sugar epimerase
MDAAARGKGFEIGYGGTAQYDFAPDVGRAFALASRGMGVGAHVVNFPGEAAAMDEVVAAIESAAPEVAGTITWLDQTLPFPERLEATRLERLLGPLVRTPLREGVRRTVEHYRRASV